MVGRTPVLVTAVIVVAVVAAALPVQVSATGDRNDPTVAGAVSETDALQTARNNSTTHHQNPENVSQAGDLLGVRRWLSSELAARLGRSAVQINRSEYELARSILGDDYDDRLGQLVDVVGETDSNDDDSLDETFEDTQRSQRNYSSTAAGYEETYEAYEQAVENGNETAARRRARQLRTIADRIRRLNRTLQADYDRLGNRTGTDLAEASDAIAFRTENITARQERIERAEFTETALRLSTESATISFADPLVATGTLTTANGTALANREVTMRIHERTKRVRTDDGGQFTLRYKPRTLPVTTSELTVAYLPGDDSVYLSTNATVAVDVEQVEANLTVTSAPEAVAFADRFQTVGRLTHEGEAVSTVPLEATIDGYRLEPGRTNGTGFGELRGRLPASVRPGSRNLTISVANRSRAVTASNVTVATFVRSTETTLTIREARRDSRTVEVLGRLQTDDGTPVPGQSVRVSTSESVVETTRTGQNGTYTIGLNRSRVADVTNGSVAVAVSFDGEGTNLESASRSTRIEVESVASGEEQPGQGSQPLSTGNDRIVSGLVLALVVLLGILLLVRRRRTGSADGESTDSSKEAVLGDDETEDGSRSLDLSPVQSLLASDRQDAAVRFAYQHVREYLAETVGIDDADTHWEFFTKCRESGLDPDRLSVLQSLVETYERVQFKDGGVLDSDFSSLVDAVEARLR